MKTKKDLILAIRKYGDRYKEESDNVERCIKLLEKYEDNRVLYRNHFEDGHFTGSVVVINEEKTKVLLMHHKKYGTWQQFGGHADGVIDIRAEAIRELEEEAGIHENDIELSQDIFNFDIHSVPQVGQEPKHFHYDVAYLAVIDEDLPYLKQEAEVHDIQWFDITEVIKELGTGKFSSGFEHIFPKIRADF